MGDGHGRKGSCPVLPKLVHMRLKMLIIILEKHMGTYGLLYTSGRQRAFTMMIVLVISMKMIMMMMVIMTMIMITLMYCIYQSR